METKPIRHYADVPISELQSPEDWLLGFIEIGAPLVYPPITIDMPSEGRKTLSLKALEKVLSKKGELFVVRHRKHRMIAAQGVFYLNSDRLDHAWGNFKENIRSTIFEYQSLRYAIEQSILDTSFGSIRYPNGSISIWNEPFEVEDLPRACEEFALLLLTFEESRPCFTKYSRLELLDWVAQQAPLASNVISNQSSTLFEQETQRNTLLLPDNCIQWETRIVELTIEEYKFLKAALNLSPEENIDQKLNFSADKKKKDRLKNSICSKLKIDRDSLFVRGSHCLKGAVKQNIRF
jgi:hypothetical protein